MTQTRHYLRPAALVILLLPGIIAFAPSRNLHCPRHAVLSMTSSMQSSLDPSEDPQSTSIFMSSSHETENNNNNRRQSFRVRMRQATGFSLTAFRATMRAATGISLSAIYASALVTTSAVVRKFMAMVLAPLPAWFRYFLQPFLILYYAPLFILRNLAGPTGKRARETHEVFVDGFKAAVDAAEQKADGYWPVHVNEQGDIVSVEPPQQHADGSNAKVNKKLDVNDGIAESIEIVMQSSGKSDEDNMRP